MPRLILETRIFASAGRCFDLARSVEVHVRTSAWTRERAVEGRTAGLLELGDAVTFEAVHFGVRLRHAARITEFDRPRRFADEMERGIFAAFRHVHEFIEEGGFTRMRDVLEWRSPWGPIGRIADRLFVERHLRNYMARKQSALKQIAEAVNETAAPGAAGLHP